MGVGAVAAYVGIGGAVAGAGAGSKLAKALSLGLPVIQAAEFEALLEHGFPLPD